MEKEIRKRGKEQRGKEGREKKEEKLMVIKAYLLCNFSNKHQLLKNPLRIIQRETRITQRVSLFP